MLETYEHSRGGGESWSGGADMMVAASWYAKHGFPVFPLHSAPGGQCSCGNPECGKNAGKHPRTEHGFKDSTTDLAQIEEWWTRWPDANIGLATGAASGSLMMDVDPRNSEQEELERLILEHGRLPDTAEQITGGGGRYIIFRHIGGLVLKTLAPGIDLKGNGGYIVVAPSVHPSGNSYQWDGIAGVKALLNPAEPPAWLLGRIAAVRYGKRAESREVGGEKWGEGERNNRLTALAGTMRRPGMSQEAIEAALLTENAKRCDPPLAEGEVRRIARSVASYKPADGDSGEWPDPEPLGSDLPPVEPFSLEWVPPSVRGHIEDVSERMQTPLDFAAAATVVALAGCINRRAVIQPKKNDTSWIVVSNLWGANVGAPGELKSPVLNAMMTPVWAIEEKYTKEHEEAVRNFELEHEKAQLEFTAWREEYKHAFKKKRELPDRPSTSLEPPSCRRLITVDATPEKLHAILAENPAGVLVVRDELTGWLAELEREGRQGERQFFLSAWNGDTPYKMDRIGRGTVHVPACCISLFGNIQPSRLRIYLGEALRDGPSNDGLFQRFQILVWPDPVVSKPVDRAPNLQEKEKVHGVFKRLTDLASEELRRMRFAADAQELFNEWLEELESKIRAGDLHPALVAHLAKYRSLMPSLALLFELADWAAGVGSGESVSLDHAKQAAAWCDYLESHARRVYSCITTPQLRAARDLADKIKRRKVGADGTFSCRDVYLKGWGGLDTPEAVKLAAEVLEDAGWVREVSGRSGPVGGRPPNRYKVNQRVGNE